MEKPPTLHWGAVAQRKPGDRARSWAPHQGHRLRCIHRAPHLLQVARWLVLKEEFKEGVRQFLEVEVATLALWGL